MRAAIASSCSDAPIALSLTCSTVVETSARLPPQTVQLLEQRIELVTLVTSGGHDRVQFVGAFLRIAAEDKLLDHVHSHSRTYHEY